MCPPLLLRGDEELGAIGVRATVRHGYEALVPELHPQVLDPGVLYGMCVCIYIYIEDRTLMEHLQNPSSLEPIWNLTEP